MRKVAPILVLRLALLVAILACAVLLVEYDNAGDPAFCGVGSGCMAVRRSAYSHIGDVPLPLIGLCAHAGLLALSLVARDRSQTFFTALAAAGGGVVALGLVGLQAIKIGAFCKWCLLVDGCAVVAAGAAVLVHVRAARSEPYEAFLAALSQRYRLVVAWVLGAAIIGGLPFVWGDYPVVPPLRPEVAALGVPGKVTIVSFTDFQCPFCRKLAPVLQDVEENWGDRMTVVRKMAPLAMHPGGMPAALAYVCTPEERRDEMARMLYAAPEAVLTRDGVQIVARDLKLDEERFARCLDGPEARAQVAADKALFAALDLHGVPYTYVGRRAVSGFNPDALRKLGREAMDGDRPGLPLWWMVAAALLLAFGLVALTVKAAPRQVEPALAPMP